MNSALDILDRGARAILARGLTDHERDQFRNYLDILTKWQKSHRLIGSSEPRWIVENLFLDSLLFLRVLPAELGSLLDLGSGAGLPGIPLKLVRPEIELVLVESRRRRASFLSGAIRVLGLPGTRVINGRAEDLIRELAGHFDAVVMRCAGDTDTLLPLAVQFVVPGGAVIASGPPEPRPLARGDWVTVAGWEPGKTRRFAVTRRT